MLRLLLCPTNSYEPCSDGCAESQRPIHPIGHQHVRGTFQSLVSNRCPARDQSEADNKMLPLKNTFKNTLQANLRTSRRGHSFASRRPITCTKQACLFMKADEAMSINDSSRHPTAQRQWNRSACVCVCTHVSAETVGTVSLSPLGVFHEAPSAHTGAHVYRHRLVQIGPKSCFSTPPDSWEKLAVVSPPSDP